MNRITDAVKHLIIINIVFFIITFVLKLSFSDSLALYFPENEKFGVWQYVSHMFIHGSPMHIIFNMYGLWAFGTPLEQRFSKLQIEGMMLDAGLGEITFSEEMPFWCAIGKKLI